eukprot:CAMPEP_0178555776 /NCGR_PEP_ID=MMETSP0697-20121206/9040_1 /TAXON_ID=265572 /ORGANISM="Extubocellulus spinifer, Strain CCMP396" /LENGTH=468 /DNA_ID=CAMNT_0020188801 /DNA_START=120 /DNA_END=1526 /DNA_ORIENTATION=+
MDAILLHGHELGLPQHIVNELLGEDQDEEEDEQCVKVAHILELGGEDGALAGSGVTRKRADSNTPTADQRPASNCPCRESRCSAGFFPTSAVFVNESQAVLLDGGSGCLKRCLLTLYDGTSDGTLDEISLAQTESFHFSDVETIPEAFHRRWGGTIGSDQFVLKEDGSAAGVVSGAFCAFPLLQPYKMERKTLRFMGALPKVNCASMFLPRIMRWDSEDATRSNDRDRFLFVLVFQARSASRIFDLYRIRLQNGFSVLVDEDSSREDADSIRALRRTTATRLPRAWENIPKDLMIESFLDLGNDCVMLLGSIRKELNDATCGTTEAPLGVRDGHRDFVLFRGRIGTNKRGAPTVEWSREKMVERRDDAVVAETSEPRKCLCMSGNGSPNNNPFFVSFDAGLTWSYGGQVRHELTGGRQGMPPVLAMSPSGRLYAFGYDSEECRVAENKRLMGKKKAIDWPILRVYGWR